MAYRVLQPGVAVPQVGRPRKHEGGYSKVTKVIRLLEKTFEEWRVIKGIEGLSDDDAVARHLLDCRKQLYERQIPHNESIW